jgi:hypothetical protein
MYKRIYDFIVSLFRLFDNRLISIGLPIFIYASVRLITHTAVNDSFNSGTFGNKLQGVISYIFIELIYIVITVGVLFLIKNAIVGYGYLERYNF